MWRFSTLTASTDGSRPGRPEDRNSTLTPPHLGPVPRTRRPPPDVPLLPFTRTFLTGASPSRLVKTCAICDVPQFAAPVVQQHGMCGHARLQRSSVDFTTKSL